MTTVFLALSIWSLTISIMLLVGYGKHVQGAIAFTACFAFVFGCIWFVLRLNYSDYGRDIDVCEIDHFIPDMSTSVGARQTSRIGLMHVYPDDDMSIRVAVLRSRSRLINKKSTSILRL